MVPSSGCPHSAVGRAMDRNGVPTLNLVTVSSWMTYKYYLSDILKCGGLTHGSCPKSPYGEPCWFLVTIVIIRNVSSSCYVSKWAIIQLTKTNIAVSCVLSTSLKFLFFFYICINLKFHIKTTRLYHHFFSAVLLSLRKFIIN